MPLAMRRINTKNYEIYVCVLCVFNVLQSDFLDLATILPVHSNEGNVYNATKATTFIYK